MTGRVPRSRQGFTLFEMLMVIGGLAIALGLCGGLLHALLRLDRVGRLAMQDTTTLARLARQFRQDVRAADEAKAEGEGRLELALEKNAVIYRIDRRQLTREEPGGDGTRRRERYDLTRLGPARFAVDRPFVRLTLKRHPTDDLAPSRPELAFEARLGKDRAREEASR